MNDVYHYESNINSSLGELDLEVMVKEIVPLFESHLTQNFEELPLIANAIRNKFNTLVVIGMGGASNSPALLLNLEHNNHFKTYVINTPAPNLNASINKQIDLKKTVFLIISKSGNTIETIEITKHWIKKLSMQNLLIKEHLYFILGQNDSSLSSIAQSNSCHIISHIDFSGRFAVFSNITILPALLMGLDAKNFLAGGCAALDEFNNTLNSSKIVKIAADSIAMLNQNISNNVTISYALELNNFLNWQCQIYAESLGKNNFGITPIKNIAPHCQHSYFQLYLQGPKDKFFTFYNVKKFSNINDEAHNLVSLIQNQSNTAYQFFKKQKLPVRKIDLQELNEYTLGFLVMNTILETAIIATHFKINLFDQPAVEEIKKLYMAN